jgi:hypothetical protein
MPFSLLYMPKAVRGTIGSAGGLYSTAGGAGGGRLSAEDAGGPVADAALLLLESRLHRPHTHPCQVCAGVCVLTCLPACCARNTLHEICCMLAHKVKNIRASRALLCT